MSQFKFTYSISGELKDESVSVINSQEFIDFAQLHRSHERALFQDGFIAMYYFDQLLKNLINSDLSNKKIGHYCAFSANDDEYQNSFSSVSKYGLYLLLEKEQSSFNGRKIYRPQQILQLNFFHITQSRIMLNNYEEIVKDCIFHIKNIAVKDIDQKLTNDFRFESIDIIDLFFELEQKTKLSIDLNEVAMILKNEKGRRFNDIKVSDIIKYLEIKSKQ